jgi:subtilisin family serine protease
VTPKIDRDYHLPPYTVSFPTTAQSQEEVDWGLKLYGIPALWRETQGEGCRIAVLDSGAAQHWALRAVVDRRNFSGDTTTDDTVGHGTHVTGIICADSPPCKGVARKAEVHSLKVLDHNGACSATSVARALGYAAAIECDFACLSLGSRKPSDILHEAIREASDKGVTVVAAAGNDGGAVNYPAAWPETVAVGAVDRHGDICPFSSRGKEIVCAAPGQDVKSTWLAGGYATVSGTSMAAPFVVGVLALYQGTLGRKLTPAEVINALQATSRDAGPEGRDDEYGYGLIDPHKLIQYKAASLGGVTVYLPEETP